MSSSLKLGTVAGIRIQIHWTFLLLVAWIVFTALASGASLPVALVNVVFVAAIFGCVVLHELGHALAARWFGIGTRDITLLPIGGVARLERMPRRPTQELVVALAGPAVNVLISAVLLALLLPASGGWAGVFVEAAEGAFLARLALVNLALVVFNLVPAFPMDGGRVLRALLAMAMSCARATRTAAVVGQTLAVAVGLFFGFSNPILLLIAVFVFFGAAAEARQVEFREQLAVYRVGDGMITSFEAVPAGVSLRELAVQLIDAPQRDYPVVRDGQLVGMLRRDDALAAVARGADGTAGDVMREVPALEASEALDTALDRASGAGSETLPVTSSGALVGLLDLGRVLQLIQARASLRIGPELTGPLARAV